MKKFRCKFESWEGSYNLSKKLSKKIIDSGYVPDIVIALARGGFVPARNVCDFLNIRDLTSIKVEHWGITATKDKKAKLRYPLAADITNKKVLVVDDIADTGESLALSVKYLKNLNPKEIKTATLHFRFNSKFVPDFYAEKIGEEDTWIIYPWHVYEDLCMIIQWLLDKGSKSEDELREGLKSEYQIAIDKKTLKEIIHELVRRGTIEKTKAGYWKTK